MPRPTLSPLHGSVVARSTDAACSRQTQAAITTCAKDTQCALPLLISTSSQTEEEFPGKQSTLEKKRAKLVEDAGLLDLQGAKVQSPQFDECTSCSLNAAELAELRAKIAALEEENAVLRQRLEAVDNYRESYNMLKKATRLVKKLEDEPARVPATPMVAIGHGVLASESVIKALKNSCVGNPTKFARALLKNLFTKEELKGKSLFGKQCNARKDLVPKVGLDRAKVQAVIDYTVAEFKADVGRVKTSLSTMLSREV